VTFCSRLVFFFQAEDGIRDRNVTGVRRVLFRSVFPAATTPLIKDLLCLSFRNLITCFGTAPSPLPPPYVGVINTYGSSTRRCSSFRRSGMRLAGKFSRSTKRRVFSETEEKYTMPAMITPSHTQTIDTPARPMWTGRVRYGTDVAPSVLATAPPAQARALSDGAAALASALILSGRNPDQ